MSKRRDQDYLSDILEAIKRIKIYTKGMTFSQFIKNNKTQDAVVRNIEVIGEATKHLSNEFRKKHPQVPWKEMAGIRDKMIHHYFGVNYEIVWTIVKQELTLLINQVKEISKKE